MAPAEKRPLRSQTAQLVNLGTLLFACVAIGLAAGFFADRWIGTKPWLLLIGLGFGIAAAGVNFYRTIKTLNQQDSDLGEQGDDR
ncbi:MAG TPA: AtpZ/AtpI family protein [Candidatus Dormibacteraeota bacterium]|jgi:ATP synthase protein I|nr:AtpZ/AtpI family protein [Candidatus Dormibacteraeota bacterium]